MGSGLLINESRLCPTKVDPDLMLLFDWVDLLSLAQRLGGGVMTSNIITKWLLINKKGLILGFIFGAFIAFPLSTLGLVSGLFESLRPLLIGPMDLIGLVINPTVQTGPNTFYIPIYNWILILGFNGICYAILGGLIHSTINRKKRNK